VEIVQENLIQLFEKWWSLLATGNSLTQLAIIALCGLLAWYANRHWQSFILKKFGEKEHKGLYRTAMRGASRLVFPLSMLLFLLIGRGIFGQFSKQTALLDILTPLLLSLAAIRVSVYLLRRVFSPSSALRAWEGVISTSAWIIVALHLVGWLGELLNALDAIAFEFGDGRFSLLTMLQLGLAAAIFVVAASWISKLIERRAKKSVHISPSMRVGLVKISRFFLYSLAILIALGSVGIDLTSLTVFGGALGVGLGFGLKSIASNFISGFILLFDRSIRPGDVITIGTRFGWVQALNARYIVVRDRDGVETLIPNENLITSEVTNWSFSDRKVRVRFPVQISYDDDPRFAMDLLVEACQINDRILKNPEPQARLIGFGDNGVDLELRLWLSDPQNGVGSVRSDVYLAIWDKFKEHHITIPFPQRDMRMVKEGEFN
jgi:small-conductance mechanosensitive channel